MIENKLADQGVEFTPINITGINQSKTYKPRTEKDLYNVYFELSSVPPIEWQRIFERVWKSSLYSMFRRTWVEDGYIVMYCGIGEIEKYHKEQLNKKVEETNALYKSYLDSTRREQKDFQEKEKAEKEKVRDALSKISF